ncbi:hypothetical protein SDRG_14858 [Saprolegnia diclina VS20]|uniref:Transmembrane protein n=1 Tax=Saprolegnia diclina (strain VS20) TaxID=1156394 RepID=T0PPF8_SAPDV|nr:hypothetical protein SDRG_14858 [Saprolegnia diclina VS20]EQC27334.1 hypothetical protein SDRG_14858 [Saprolegnia diclina VS20]|eukprot:XP_008619238.1 hypothetical protein SDRG_14858 [Saprolegnia diclina VS20]
MSSRRRSSNVVVKSKSQSQIYAMHPGAGQGHTLYAKASLRIQQVLTFGAYVLGILVVALVCIDALFNNWAINDFVGNGYMYATAVATITNTGQLASLYAFPKGWSLRDVSNIGAWNMNYTLTNLVTPSNPNIYLLDAGTFVMDSTFATFCTIFKKTYPVDLANGSPQLGVVQDAITFLRGNAFTHVSTDEGSVNLANGSMNHLQLAALGYTPTRQQTDMRLTEPIPVKNVSTPQMLNVSFYRYQPKCFCTGCVPIASFGYASCELTMTYNTTAKTLKITNTSHVEGALWSNGLMLQQSVFSSVSNYLKCIALVFALGGYIASRRTVQWQDADVHSIQSFLHRVVKTVLPEKYPHVSKALRFDMFCYNSDIFVLLYTTGVILDMGRGIMFIREVNWFNQLKADPWMSIQTFALSTRLLWLNCAFLKVLKFLVNLVSSASYCGESKLMGFCNFTSVTSLYLSAVLLFYVPAFIESLTASLSTFTAVFTSASAVRLLAV